MKLYFVQFILLEKKIKYNFSQDHFSKLISKKSKTQVINIKNKEDLKKYFKKI